MKFITHNLEETWEVARESVAYIMSQEDRLYKTGDMQVRATVVGLYGDLGSGKTSFVQGLAKYFNIIEHVVSPTFVIEKIYQLGVAGRPFTHLIHIDAYRLEKSDELLHLNWQEIISDSHNLIVIEWPERVIDIMPEHIKISFTARAQSDEREIEIMV